MGSVTSLTLVFAGIGATGVVYGTVAQSGPLLRVLEGRHRRLERERREFGDMFARLYRFVMDDLDGDGRCKPAKAQVFAEVAGNVMYLHSGGEAEAWGRFRDAHDL
jgi:hypothetical protein